MGNELTVFKNYMAKSETKNRFEEILDKNAASYMASVVNAVSGNASLQKCEPGSIMSAAFVAAALKLPIDPNLGFSYIIPYGKKAQFQIGYKGFIQLAIRSGQYKNIHVSEVYEDELKYYNPVTGDIEFTDISTWKIRYEGKQNPVGYYAKIQLLSGFEKHDFMLRVQAENHALKFSQTYKKYKSGVWKDDFDAMAKKTVLKLLLNKFGILSTEMQNATIKDQTIDNNYGDSPANPQAEIENEANQGEVIDVEPNQEKPDTTPENKPAEDPGF